jgi:hypothetical protein
MKKILITIPVVNENLDPNDGYLKIDSCGTDWGIPIDYHP